MDTGRKKTPSVQKNESEKAHFSPRDEITNMLFYGALPLRPNCKLPTVFIFICSRKRFTKKIRGKNSGLR
jgi:hypothetical protein